MVSESNPKNPEHPNSLGNVNFFIAKKGDDKTFGYKI